MIKNSMSKRTDFFSSIYRNAVIVRAMQDRCVIQTGKKNIKEIIVRLNEITVVEN